MIQAIVPSLEALESRCHLSAVPLAVSSHDAHEAHLAHQAHLRHVRHVRHVRSLSASRALRQAQLAAEVTASQIASMQSARSAEFTTPAATGAAPTAGVVMEPASSDSTDFLSGNGSSMTSGSSMFSSTPTTGESILFDTGGMTMVSSLFGGG